MEGGIDAVQGLVQILHEDDAVVVFVKDGIDAAAEMAQEQHRSAPHPRNKQDERKENQNDAITKRECHHATKTRNNLRHQQLGRCNFIEKRTERIVQSVPAIGIGYHSCLNSHQTNHG